MKIYWTRKNIPELSALPPSLRKKNFTDAYNAASSHIEYWIGAGVSFISMMILFRVYNFLLPAQDTFPGDIIRSLCVVCPSILIWFQFSVYVMRKYYRHILERGKETETISERLIREADTREYELWRPVHRFFLHCFSHYSISLHSFTDNNYKIKVMAVLIQENKRSFYGYLFLLYKRILNNK